MSCGHLEKGTVHFWILSRRGLHTEHMADRLAAPAVSICSATHLPRAWRHHASSLPLVQTCVLLNHSEWQQTVRHNEVKHNKSWLHRSKHTYQKLKTVYSFMSTVHYSLVFVSLAMGQTVLSINPKHCCSGAPLACTAAAKDFVSSHTRFRSPSNFSKKKKGTASRLQVWDKDIICFPRTILQIPKKCPS